LICQKSDSQKIFDPKVRIFDGFLDVEGADRLPPFKSETPKSRKNSRFWAGSDYTRHLILWIISFLRDFFKCFSLTGIIFVKIALNRRQKYVEIDESRFFLHK